MQNLEKYFAGRRILVVGGRGFIGRHLSNYLTNLGSHVTTLSITEPKEHTNGSNMGHLAADLRNPESLRNAIGDKHFDYVVNSGGYIDHTLYFSGGRDLVEQHFVGTMNLLDLIKGTSLKGWVQLGSSDEYGLLKAPQKENSREMPISPYSLAKAVSTHFLQMLYRTENVPCVVVRLFLVYGPGQSDERFLPQVIRSCLAGEVFKASEGMQLRDFCYIDDVVEGVLLAMVKEEAHGKVINIASGQPVTIRDMIEKVVSAIGGGEPDYGKIPYRKGENMALYADIKLAKEILGWQPTTDIDEGLKKTIAWYRQTLKTEGRD